MRHNSALVHTIILVQLHSNPLPSTVPVDLGNSFTLTKHTSCLHSIRDASGQQPRQPRGRGGGRQRPQGPCTQQQQQLDSQLRNDAQKQQQQQSQEADVEAAVHATGSSPDRSSSRTPSTTSRSRAVAANHLLNFQYDHARGTRVSSMCCHTYSKRISQLHSC